ncbi:BTB/POZ domain [Geosmithia morbida]|uniref:BTB/POZ domain n=1 Tax=Geosmithia morbida TaxID=1094350 RepID=A0A9P5D376_9HYPO|nr:BTB/POZ domain [Geosmithia morbida]KAF4122251.1 BTB/POZ domain [Geosmithia morbida]
MFKRSHRSRDHSQSRVDKTARLKKQGSQRDPTKVSRLQRSLQDKDELLAAQAGNMPNAAPSPIVTLTIGREGRLFAAHEDVLRQSPFFDMACRDNFFDSQSRRIFLPDEEPEIFSAVLEYLYKGDYCPRLVPSKQQRNTWELENNPTTPSGRSPRPSPNPANPRGGRPAGVSPDAVVYLSSVGAEILRDTVVYCAAERYGLDELKRLALYKQGLQAGIDVGTILRSAQYAYAHTPDSDSRLRAHYLALIIRCRKTFKRSGTMQAEMEAGGSKLFFDLFVAMCNHLDDVIDVSNARSPKAV